MSTKAYFLRVWLILLIAFTLAALLLPSCAIPGVDVAPQITAIKRHHRIYDALRPSLSPQDQSLIDPLIAAEDQAKANYYDAISVSSSEFHARIKALEKAVAATDKQLAKYGGAH
jgi:hypothetical protein